MFSLATLTSRLGAERFVEHMPVKCVCVCFFGGWWLGFSFLGGLFVLFPGFSRSIVLIYFYRLVCSFGGAQQNTKQAA